MPSERAVGVSAQARPSGPPAFPSHRADTFGTKVAPAPCPSGPRVLSADGARLFVAAGSEVSAYDTRTWTQQATVVLDQAPSSLALAPGGSFLTATHTASAEAAAGSLDVIASATLELRKNWKRALVRSARGSTFAFSPNAALFALVPFDASASSGDAHRVELYATADWSKVWEIVTEGTVAGFEFSAVGDRLAVLAGETLELFDTKAQKSLGKWPSVSSMFPSALGSFWQHERTLVPFAGGGSTIQFSPDGRWLRWSDAQNGSALVDTRRGARKLLVNAKCTSDHAMFTPDSRTLVMNGASGLCAFDAETGRVRTFLPHPTSNDFRKNDPLAITADGSLLVVGGPAFVEIWDVPHHKAVIDAITSTPVFRKRDGVVLVLGGSSFELAPKGRVSPIGGAPPILDVLGTDAGAERYLVAPGRWIDVAPGARVPEPERDASGRPVVDLYTGDPPSRAVRLQAVCQPGMLAPDLVLAGNLVVSVNLDVQDTPPLPIQVWDAATGKLTGPFASCGCTANAAAN